MGGDLEELSTLYQYDPIRERWSGVSDVSNAALARPRTSFVAIPLPDYLSCANNFRPRVTQTRSPYGRRQQQYEQQNHRRVDAGRNGYGRVEGEKAKNGYLGNYGFF